MKIICTDLTVPIHNKIVEWSNLLCLVPFLKTKHSQDLNVMGNVNAPGCLAVFPYQITIGLFLLICPL